MKARARENIQEKGTTTRMRLDLEDGQRTLGDFAIKRQRAEFVGDVQENDDCETPRLHRAVYVHCVQTCKSVMMDSTELPSSSKKFFDGSEEPAGTHEKCDQSAGEVLFAVGCRDDQPIVDSGSVVSTCTVDYATSDPIDKVHQSLNLESLLGESLHHYGIKRNVPFTNRTGSSMNVNSEVTDTNVQVCLCIRAAARAPNETDHGEHTRIRHCV